MVSIIAVIGFRKSGKTTIIRELLHSLGDKVVIIKDIHDYGQEFDSRNKDTWIFSREGAYAVVGLAPDKTHILVNSPIELNEVIQLTLNVVKPRYVILEGFKNKIKDRSDVIKIITLRSIDELSELANGVKPPMLVYCGFCGCNINGCISSMDQLVNAVLRIINEH
ncbi:molybdopterin-guanine dinucleotide biosynthesis protein MobB [Caldivirga sp.]|uniref:molybdopterin-guanine dinucleotide biosynthesis protein MobB n=1 Tax=Caldivirga sp. TaxID=2080243 RepID=UPI0025C5CBA9|nr:molybdopterin-guanine dinucleotide biosynthesis protein MobB [Caldivirga sp.]